MYKYLATKSCACAKENAHTGACRNVVWPRARACMIYLYRKGLGHGYRVRVRVRVRVLAHDDDVMKN